MSERIELHVGGATKSGQSASWTHADLARLSDAVQIADVGVFVPGRKGRGVRLSALIEAAAPEAGVAHVHVASRDPAFAISLPLHEVALTGIVVYEVDGRPLDAKQGGPFRLLVPGHPDECVNVKAISRLDLARTPGRDTRPVDDAEHEKLHKKR